MSGDLYVHHPTGRHGYDHRQHIHPHARRIGNLLAALVCALLALTLAAPGALADDPTTGPAHKNPLPVTIVIDSVTPTSLGPDGTLTITATVTNTGKETIDNPWVRLQRDDDVTNRSQLLKLDKSQPGYTQAIGPIHDLTASLGPGASQQIKVTATTAELKINDQGIYPVLININGETNSGPIRVGQAAISVPYFETAPTAPTRVGWVLPLIDRPHRSAQTNVFLDDELNTLVSPGGRLNRLLAAAEKYAGKSQLSLIVDPELISALSVMTGGYQYVAQSGSHKGEVVTGEGGDKAASWLDRLTALAKTVPIMTTPYADVDTAALARNNLADMIISARKTGTSVVDSILKTQTVHDVDMPAGGVTTDQVIAADQQAGVRKLILSGAAYGQSDYLESSDGVTENAATVLNVPGASIEAVVADPALTRILGEGSTYAAGPVAGAQRFGAELAAISMQQPAVSRGMLVVPPRRWDPSQKLLDAVFTETTTTPWVAPLSFDTLAADTPVARGALDYPASASTAEIPGTALTHVVQSAANINAMRSMFTEADADTMLEPYNRALFRMVSSAYRGDPAAVEARADDVDSALAQIRNDVQIVPPSDGTYTLSSSTAPLPFTVQNKLGVPVKYVLGLDEARSSGVKVGGTQVLQIAPNSRATVKVPTVVERSGVFSVVAQIHTPDGLSLGTDVVVSVRSSVYGGVALGVTGAAFAILLLLIARRYVIRRRNKRRQREADARAADAALLEQPDEPVPFGDYSYRVDEGGTTASIVLPPDPANRPERVGPADGADRPDSTDPPRRPDPAHEPNPPDDPDDPDDKSWLDEQIGKPE
ncbi:hypothetical protein CLV47_1049 [Antricoccus suffuscus]|uniref:Uncharacterized protein n=1 Tax=Antricoccus suffuscus TaxID=1629062 RepID=A0A2T1A231_9ACTN|nr:DUF6049 family protein [Antricoccus suffuscus]PRZ42665.1 hypothetical protein CLV47_1049 [Antricoccus suffuscus]